MPRLNRVIVPVNALNKGILAATAAGLIYTSDRRPGIKRLGRGKRFRYVDAHGRVITKLKTTRVARATHAIGRLTESESAVLGLLQNLGRHSRGAS